jgi:hypothetical protein
MFGAVPWRTLLVREDISRRTREEALRQRKKRSHHFASVHDDHCCAQKFGVIECPSPIGQAGSL